MCSRCGKNQVLKSDKLRLVIGLDDSSIGQENSGSCMRARVAAFNQNLIRAANGILHREAPMPRTVMTEMRTQSFRRVSKTVIDASSVTITTREFLVEWQRERNGMLTT